MTKSQGHVLEEDISKGPSWLSLAKRLASVTAVTRPILVTILVHREIWALCLTGNTSPAKSRQGGWSSWQSSRRGS